VCVCRLQMSSQCQVYHAYQHHPGACCGYHCAHQSVPAAAYRRSQWHMSPPSLTRHVSPEDLQYLQTTPTPSTSDWSSDHICTSLIDTSQRPAALNDAVCMYIDYLTRHNDQLVGGPSGVLTGADRGRLDPAVSTLITDHVYRDLFCQPCSFPTSRFRQWLNVYSVDLEITDPGGSRLNEATFAGCSCDVQVHEALSEFKVFDDDKLSVSAAAPSGGCLPVHACCATLCARSSGRARRGRGRGRGGGVKRTYKAGLSLSHQLIGTGDVAYRSLSSDYSDDSAIVEFLASLQSDAAKRRFLQRRHHRQQQAADKVIEEVVDDDLQLDVQTWSGTVPES